MKRYSIVLAILLCSFSSCKEKAPIEKNKMVDMVADYYLLEAASRHEIREIKSTDMNVYYADFLKSYGVTAAEFDSAVSYYSAHPLEFEEIYAKAIKKINAKQDELDKQLNQ